MSKDNQQKRQLAAEDRLAMRAELAAEEAEKGRLEVFDALAKQADEPEDDVPAMPDALREKLVEKFGSPEPKAAPQPSRSTPIATPGVFARLSEFFAQKEVAWGGLAVAACALLLAVFLPRGDTDPIGPIDSLRGGGGNPSASEAVTIYIFPESKAAAVMALMNPDCPATLCSGAADFGKRLAAQGEGHAVSADLDRRVVTTYHDGEAIEETPVEGAGATDILLGLRAATDAVHGDAD